MTAPLSPRSYEKGVARICGGKSQKRGSGTFGEVVSIGGPSHKRVAKSQKPESDLYFVKAEIEVLRRTDIPHIPQLYEAALCTDGRSTIVMDDAGTDLSKIFIKPEHGRAQHVTLNKIESITKKILEALRSLHANGLGHFDIKPANCSKDYVFDFGLSAIVPPGGLNGKRFTRCFKPPEAFLGLSYDQRADLWSLGCLIYKLVTTVDFLNCARDRKNPVQSTINTLHIFMARLGLQAIPFKMASSSPLGKELFEPNPTHTPLRLKPRQNATSPSPYFRDTLLELDLCKESSPARFRNFVDLLSQMLTFDPEERITAEQALDHPFFTGVDSSDIAFRPIFHGKRSMKVRIFDSVSNSLLRTIAYPSQGVPCYHIKKKPSYRVEIWDKDTKKAIWKEMAITNGSTPSFSIDLEKNPEELKTN